MALGAVQAITALGTTPNFQTPAATENIAGGRDLWLHVKNSGSSGTVTITDPGATAAGSVATNPVVTIPATTGEKLIFLPASLTSPTAGTITVAFATGTFTATVYYG